MNEFKPSEELMQLMEKIKKEADNLSQIQQVSFHIKMIIERLNLIEELSQVIKAALECLRTDSESCDDKAKIDEIKKLSVDRLEGAFSAIYELSEKVKREMEKTFDVIGYPPQDLVEKFLSFDKKAKEEIKERLKQENE